MTTHKVYNLIILDESGSMQSIKNATISGFNEVLQTIKGMERKYPELQQFVSFISFNGMGIKTLIDMKPAIVMKELDEKKYRPDSNTPLFDAIGFSVNKLKTDIEEEIDKNVLVTILTDGEENSSREYDVAGIKSLIEELRAQGWTFAFIGANQEVEKVAFSISIKNCMHFEADDQHMHHMFSRETVARERFNMNVSQNIRERDGLYDEEEK
jgi:Mg-chelatase subunit ChlD